MYHLPVLLHAAEQRRGAENSSLSVFTVTDWNPKEVIPLQWALEVFNFNTAKTPYYFLIFLLYTLLQFKSLWDNVLWKWGKYFIILPHRSKCFCCCSRKLDFIASSAVFVWAFMFLKHLKIMHVAFVSFQVIFNFPCLWPTPVLPNMPSGLFSF